MKRSAEELIPLTTLESRVSEFAARCNPDHTCTGAIVEEARFEAIDFDEEPESPLVGQHVLLLLNEQRHLWTDWSRLQLLSHLGTREKWFTSVTARQQAEELTQRVHTFTGHRLRTMNSLEPGISVLRGLVSKEYAEISDTVIMTALCALMPDGKCLESVSKKTDRAMYAYAVVDGAPIGLRGKLMGRPGVILKNSEVGFTSLWMIPFLHVETGGGFAQLAFERHVLLRRVHRGSVADLHSAFSDALKKLGEVWAPIEDRLKKLQTVTYLSEDEAVGSMRSHLSAMGETKAAMLDYERTYRAAGHTLHDALSILQAVLTTSRAVTADAAYDEAELAGALLLRLL